MVDLIGAQVVNGCGHTNGTAAMVHTNGGDRVLAMRPSKATVVLGAQWGDEGKGKLVDLLAAHSDIVCRCQVSHVHPVPMCV